MSTRARIAVIGSTGRMGQEILGLAEDDPRFRIVAGLAQGQTPLVPLNCSTLSELPADDLDVIIDFSQPEIFESVVEWCRTHSVALVSGVTGISEAQMKALSAAAENIPVLWAPNMSVGVAVVAEMLQQLARLKAFEFQIEEVHHKHKKDKPSGTALFLQQRLEKEVGRKLPEALALRGGGVFGIHKIWAMGEEEIVTIEHTAMNRRVFARGALQAAHWISGRSRGLYRMVDVLA